jgi:hypothetical protein
MEIDHFLSKCRKAPDACEKVVALYQAFLRTLPPGGHWGWPRKRFVYELTVRGFPIGKRRRVAYFAGVGLDDPPRQGWVVDASGSLRLRPIENDGGRDPAAALPLP